MALQPPGRVTLPAVARQVLGAPRHFTVAFDDLDKGVEALRSCEHLVWQNPYHEE